MFNLNYYPFGMLTPGRKYNAGEYRFGFNGQEKDDEVIGIGNSISYDARIYNPRLGKFLSVDPRLKEYPSNSPFLFAGNNPIYKVDLEGKGEINYWMHLLQLWLGIAPKPSNSDEAAEQAAESSAMREVKKDVEQLAENTDTYIFNWVPGLNAAKEFKDGNSGQAGLILIADLFGGRIAGKVVKDIGIKLPVTLATLNKNIEGKGLNILKSIIAKTEGQAKQLSDETVTGAAKEILGIPIENPKVNASLDGHIQKVQQALAGIKNQINELRNGIESGTFTDGVAKEADRVSRLLQKEKDRITNQLNRAANKSTKKQ